jgi:hypothetical protein
MGRLAVAVKLALVASIEPLVAQPASMATHPSPATD